MSRTLVIGDIHGAYKALEQVLELAKVNTSDKLIFLGDYVDGWPESYEVVKKLIELSNQSVFLMGNHDDWCLEHLSLLNSGLFKVDRVWDSNGGSETIKSFLKHNYLDDHKIKRELFNFFKLLKSYYIINNKLFVHAGFLSQIDITYNNLETLLWSRTMWNHAVYNSMKKFDPDENLSLYDEIYIGHTPTINYGNDKPMNCFNVWNLDTGAGWSGKLTIMDIETKEFWQSDKAQDLYPEHKGRN